jgi:transposase InsO family protein
VQQAAAKAVNALCQMTGLSRAGYYRWRLPPLTTTAAMELRSQMQQIALPAYGYRRITAELQRRGYGINHKRVLRLMPRDNLLCLRPRSFLVTTDSSHNLPVYPNLARGMQPTAMNQLWVADITYIGIRTEFVYLAVVLDGFSRRVIGWAFGAHAGSQTGGGGPEHGTRSAEPGSGTGAPFRSGRAVCFGRVHGPAAPAPGANQDEPPRQSIRQCACEWFLVTLKCEEVYRNEYRDLPDALSSIGEFIEQVYNQTRWHSALGYVPPVEFQHNGGASQ